MIGVISASTNLAGLQWGRDRAVSEISRAGTVQRAAIPGFNGAETARSRKCPNCANPPHEGPWLQWGRDRAVSEIHPFAPVPALIPDASMGPRPRGLGNDFGGGGRQSVYRLQWGRDRAVSEIEPASGDQAAVFLASMGPRPRGLGNVAPLACALAAVPLQWGRDRAVSEIAPVRAPT